MDLLSDQVAVERRVVDELQRPRPYEQSKVGAGLVSALGEPAEADVGEGAAHVGEHLNGPHRSDPLGDAGSLTACRAQLTRRSAGTAPTCRAIG